jgi:hypothetical protein
VGIEHDDRARSQASDDCFDVADAHAGVKEQRLLGADDQVRDGLFGLMRLVKRENAGRDFVNLKPGFIRYNSLKIFIIEKIKNIS